MSLKKYLPSKLYNEKTLSEIYSIQEDKLNSINNNIQDLIDNCFIQTATWSLYIWEKEYGITTIETDSYEIRRSRILAQKRSNGIVNAKMITKLVESFTNGTVKVIEDPVNYQFTIRFIDIMGIPPKIEDLYDAINKIKPAPLTVNYEFKFTTFADLSGYSWEKVSQYSWNQILNGVLEGKITTMYSKLSDGTFKEMKFLVEN